MSNGWGSGVPGTGRIPAMFGGKGQRLRKKNRGQWSGRWPDASLLRAQNREGYKGLQNKPVEEWT